MIVGMDTDFDSTPRRLGMGWAVRRDGVRDFVGGHALDADRRACRSTAARRARDRRAGAGRRRPAASPTGAARQRHLRLVLAGARPHACCSRSPTSSTASCRRRVASRRPRGARVVDAAVLRPRGRACSRLSRVRATRVVAAAGGARRARAGPPDAPALRLAPDDAAGAGRRRTAAPSTTRTRSSWRTPAAAGAWLAPAERGRAARPPRRVATARATRARAGRARRAAREGARRPRRGRCCSCRAPFAAELAERLAVNEFVERRIALSPAPPPRRSYDVVIVGGGGHGLATAYYLATRHGITDVAVLERGYIGSGNSGRNTTVIRANYGIPEAVAFYQRSLELYERSRGGARPRGDARARRACSGSRTREATLRTEKARAQSSTRACGAETELRRPGRDRASSARSSTSTGERTIPRGRRLLPPARRDRPPRPRRVGATPRARCSAASTSHQGVAVTGLVRDGARVVGVETSAGRIGAGVVARRGRRARHDARGDGRRAPADPHAPAAGVRHEPLRRRSSGRS